MTGGCRFGRAACDPAMWPTDDAFEIALCVEAFEQPNGISCSGLGAVLTCCGPIFSAHL